RYGDAASILLVAPVRREAVFGTAVHVPRADLQLHWFSRGPDHRGVQRLVQVELGHRDVVLEPAGNRLVARVHGAKDGVAVANGLDEDANAHEVVDVVE